MKEEIGSGAYGTIYSIKSSSLKKCRIEHEEIAVKVIEINEIGIHSLMEVSIMATYKHPSLINSIHIEVNDDKLHIYQEKAKYDMKRYMDINKDYINSNNKFDLLYNHFLQISGGIQFMHSSSMIHGDIKPQNILIFEQDGGYIAKLCDFGCSTVIKRTNKNSRSGTIRYNAPEVLINSTSSFPSDIWSLGCLLYEMATGKALIPDYKDNMDKEIEKEKKKKRAMLTAKTLQMWREGEGDIIYGKLPEHDIIPIMFRLSGFIGNIVKHMTCYSPEDRPDILTVTKKIRSHSNIKSGNFKCDIKCKIIEPDVYKDSYKLFEQYMLQRNLEIPAHLINKASEILSIASKTTLEYIEASLVMSFKIHDGFIEDYHPISDIESITRAELDICVTNKFRIHKFATNDLYVSL